MSDEPVRPDVVGRALRPTNMPIEPHIAMVFSFDFPLYYAISQILSSAPVHGEIIVLHKRQQLTPDIASLRA